MTEEQAVDVLRTWIDILSNEKDVEQCRGKYYSIAFNKSGEPVQCCAVGLYIYRVAGIEALRTSATIDLVESNLREALRVLEWEVPSQMTRYPFSLSAVFRMNDTDKLSFQRIAQVLGNRYQSLLQNGENNVDDH